MHEEIQNKLHAILSKRFEKEEDREEIIIAMGEAIWSESLVKVLEVFPEEKRAEVVSLLNQGNIEAVVASMDEQNIDIDTILSETATSVMNEVML